jgi:hypothetical protein
MKLFRMLYLYRMLVWRTYYKNDKRMFTSEEVKYREKKIYPLRMFLTKIKCVNKKTNILAQTY